MRAVQKQAPSPAIERDTLLRQIAVLDDAFAQGKIKEVDYSARRAELKEELRELWDDETTA